MKNIANVIPRPSIMRTKASLRSLFWRMKLVMGLFDSLKDIEPERIMRLVFVCRGNVCRSPYAEAAAKSLGLSAISCGVDVKRSAPAETMAVSAAMLRSKDLSLHMSRSIFDVPLDRSDCLVAMDPTHLPIAWNVAARSGCQITLLGLWRGSSVIEIADPYGMPENIFSHCFNDIDECLENLIRRIKIDPPI